VTSQRAPRPAVCVVGDALLDIDWVGNVSRVCRDAPAPVLDTPCERARPGGAALAACLAARQGADVTLVTGLGIDDAGRRLAGLLREAGVELVDLGLGGPMPVKLRLRADGHSIARVDQACTPVLAPGRWTASAAAAVAGADVVHVADYGRGLAALPDVAAATRAVPTVWDPHPGGPRPPATATLVTPNLAEAQYLAGHDGPVPSRLPEVVDLATAVAQVVGAPTSVTAGPLGAVLADGAGPPAVVPAVSVPGDACGAGDQFAATAAVCLGRGLPVLEAVEAAGGAAAAFVAAGGARPALDGMRGVVPLPSRHRTAGDAVTTARAVRRAGGVVVAAGGCFDVLHAGHVQLLEGARRLGDHLVVCLNSDDSVRRLKGPGRPLNPAEDRMAVLSSLACVDGVVVFDDDTPSRALATFRPHLFVKGADYQGVDLEEAEALAGWGGHVVLLPLMADHSTTRIIRVARAAG
jgi:D-beta-D-heptose 7-phosphate kinase / D-beta-D-heptose 1-phosphate adenosyltransferase